MKRTIEMILKRITKTIDEKHLRPASTAKVDIYKYQSRYFVFCFNGAYRFDHNGRWMDILPTGFVNVPAKKITTV